MLIQADASAYSLGAVLKQGERPVEFVAKSLSDTQQHYSPIEKGMLTVVHVCNGFMYYILVIDNVVVETDHKPLLGIMRKEISSLTPRLGRMRLDLMTYPKLELVYRPGKELVLADTLSRACPPGTDIQIMYDPMLQVCSLVVSLQNAMVKYRGATNSDEQLAVVVKYIEQERSV